MRLRFSALALDFDGVLFDSVPECLRLSYAVYRSLEEGGGDDPASALEAEPSPEDSGQFLARRGLVRPAGHYYLLWKWLRAWPDRRLTPALFEALEHEFPAAVRAFEERFFAWRTAFREASPARWLELNQPFPGVVEHWSRIRCVPRFIVTTKDRESVSFLLAAHGLEISGLYAKGEFALKTEPLRTIVKSGPFESGRVLFVDDNASHLRDGLAAGVTARWAAWGYDPDGGLAAPALPDFAALADFVEGVGPLDAP